MMYCINYYLYLLLTFFLQKYHDFPEMATESISAYTKDENGKTTPMWTKEEVDEIVAAQVGLYTNLVTTFIFLPCTL